MANLYQHSAAMLDRLSAVPGFEDAFLAGSDSSVDPVTRLWDCLRNGASLCYLINYLHPNAIETVHSPQQAQFTSNLAKANIYHFLIACKTVLKMDDTSLFTIRELTMNDTNGFIRVLRTLETVMQLLDDDILVKRAREQRLSSFRSSKSVDFRLSMESATNNAEKVIAELLETERKYVADLELLQDYKRTVVESQVVSEHISRQIFGNIDQLVDFQRKFLIGVEDACRSTNRAERIAQLFESNENYFSVYAPYCANHRAAAEAALGAAPELAKLKNGIEPNYDLPSFLIKPIQRICKYPLLLRELNRFIPEVLIHLKKSLTNAGESINRVASMINELRRLEENAILVQTLEKQVEDWKGFNIQNFGNLLLDVNLIMIRRGNEREMHVFLFERILICCKEIKKEKKRSLSISRKTNSISSEKSYQLKGGVAVSQMEGVIASNQNNTPELKVFYKDSESGEMESFVLKFLNDEQAHSWQSLILSLIAQLKRHGSSNDEVNDGSRTREPSTDCRRKTNVGKNSTLATSVTNDSAHRVFNDQMRRDTWTLEQAMSELDAFKEESTNDENRQPPQIITPVNSRRPTSSTAALQPVFPDYSVKAKVHFHDEIFALIIDDEWTFEQLFGVLTDKVSQFDSMLSRNSVFKLRYKDEDGDYISIRSDDDLRLAIKLCMTGRYALNLYLTAIQ